MPFSLLSKWAYCRHFGFQDAFLRAQPQCAITAFTTPSPQEVVNLTDPGPLAGFSRLPNEVADMIWREAILEHLGHATTQVGCVGEHNPGHEDRPGRIDCPIRRVCRAANAAYVRLSYFQAPIYHMDWTNIACQTYMTQRPAGVLNDQVPRRPVALYVHAPYPHVASDWAYWASQRFPDVETLYLSAQMLAHSPTQSWDLETPKPPSMCDDALVLETNDHTYWLPPTGLFPAAWLRTLPTLGPLNGKDLPRGDFHVWETQGSAQGEFPRLQTASKDRWAEVIRFVIHDDGTTAYQPLWPKSYNLQVEHNSPAILNWKVNAWRLKWPKLRIISLCAWEGPPLRQARG